MMNIPSNNHHNEKRIISFERALQIDSKNNYIIIKRITYLFQVRNNYELVWDANISKLEILNKGNSKIFHPKSNSSEYFVIQRNMKNNTYIYKYTSEKKELILLKIHNFIIFNIFLKILCVSTTTSFSHCGD